MQEKNIWRMSNEMKKIPIPKSHERTILHTGSFGAKAQSQKFQNEKNICINDTYNGELWVTEGFISACHYRISWWRHQMKAFSASLAFCAGNSPVTGEFPVQRPVMRGFDVFFDAPEQAVE